MSTRIAGEILQIFITYQFKLAIGGDFSSYTSKPHKDFIYESNKEISSSYLLRKKLLLDWATMSSNPEVTRSSDLLKELVH